MTINGIFQQLTGFSISHLGRHGHARLIATQPPARRRDEERGGRQENGELRRMDSPNRNSILGGDEIETFAFERETSVAPHSH